MKRGRFRELLRTIFKQRSGQALVETALTVPVLLVMLIGIAEIAHVGYVSIETANAARAAVQYAAMNGGDYLDTAGMLAAAQSDSADLNKAITSVTLASVTCSCSGTGTASCSTTTPPTGCTTSTIQTTVTVKVSAKIASIFKLPFLPTQYTLQGYAQQQILP